MKFEPTHVCLPDLPLTTLSTMSLSAVVMGRLTLVSLQEGIEGQDSHSLANVSHVAQEEERAQYGSLEYH
ncbi:hypothetical protein E2C01_080357 [Portunus trituberculatus]|uniref:Uncharacterized protein n=1 Tax=Portunus trituberculatus TaxID=210409 RepID=A0A5B7IV78_PORTR|nr:hypothetical protein [Portunus trituberculatus]